MNNIISMILTTFIPFLELRFSIPYGILILKENIGLVFLVCTISNILLGIILYPMLERIISILTKIAFIDRLYSSYVKKTQKKIKKYVNKYGWLGVAIFIGIPLPGSGVYSGSIASYLIGLNYKRFIIATVLGVFMAAIIVSAVVLTGSSTFSMFVKL